MNCHNADSFLREAIQSVYNQSFQDWEIVLVDNASTDKTREIAKSFDERVKYYYYAEKTKLGESRNRALSHVNTEYIAFLDSDDRFLPGKFEKVVNVIRSSAPDFIFSNFYYLKGDKQYLGLHLKNHHHAFSKNFFVRDYIINLQTVVLKRSLIDKHQFRFDPQLQILEEFNFFLNYLDKTDKLVFIDEPLSVYRIHANSDSFKLFREADAEMLRVSSDLYSRQVITKEEFDILSRKADFLKIKSLLIEGRKWAAISLAIKTGKLAYLAIAIVGYNFFKKIYFFLSKRIIVP